MREVAGILFETIASLEEEFAGLGSEQQLNIDELAIWTNLLLELLLLLLFMLLELLLGLLLLLALQASLFRVLLLQTRLLLVESLAKGASMISVPLKCHGNGRGWGWHLHSRGQYVRVIASGPLLAMSSVEEEGAWL